MCLYLLGEVVYAVLARCNSDVCVGSHWMMTPCIRCDGSGGCRLDNFMWKPSIVN